ncbi:chromosomal replication initiator DnaA [Halovulum dunhuangense]|uniref:Chromosomal replication initiator DnaA n=1 Tax=Halovulum dunhuangense TaxID=1505036 RepID=A0A849L4T7_9RHOB|nr:DnaA/Hda family protein [Halovulum dunhuangense]NNU81202.1 chromosomal replication initiator DnaA [Halovulum dunhuangense]
MAGQLSLDLKFRPALGREAFLVSESNATALAAVEAWKDWPGGKLALCGPAGAGKTHLAHVWAEMTGASIVSAKEAGTALLGTERLVIEDVDRVAGDPAAEERLFHLHNATLAAGGRLLVTGRSAPRHWALGLPDLASRLSAAGVARLESPDEALLAGVLVKLFADRQIRVKPALVSYLTRRIDRSIPAAQAAVAALDRASLAGARPVGVKLAAELLGE